MFPYELDLSWVIAFQSLGDWLVSPMQFFSFLGTEEFYILILPILYWCIDTSLGIRVGIHHADEQRLEFHIQNAIHRSAPVLGQCRSQTIMG